MYPFPATDRRRILSVALPSALCSILDVKNGWLDGKIHDQGQDICGYIYLFFVGCLNLPKPSLWPPITPCLRR